MYPNFNLIFEAVLLSWLSAINTFSFFALIAFITAVYITISEIKRHEHEGNLKPLVRRRIIGNTSIVVLFLLITTAFIIGFGISELLWLITTTSENTIVGSELRDNLILGLAAAFSIGYLKYRQIKRQQLAEAKIVAIYVFPHQRITGVVILAITAGLIGPKIFQLATTWPHFIQNPLDNIFSVQGLTFYGGLICAFFTVYFFSRKTKISFSRLCDATAPGMMLAYAIRRLGCHFSHDGDWGIIPASGGSVLPISLYESIICVLLFFILWSLRKRLKQPFQIFGLYLLLAGSERFLIEKIRINYNSEWKFINLTQPEIMSFMLVAMGMVLFFTHKKFNRAN